MDAGPYRPSCAFFLFDVGYVGFAFMVAPAARSRQPARRAGYERLIAPTGALAPERSAAASINARIRTHVAFQDK